VPRHRTLMQLKSNRIALEENLVINQIPRIANHVPATTAGSSSVAVAGTLPRSQFGTRMPR
jgi:hypothetical protein